MIEFEARGMEEHAFQALAPQIAVPFEVAIFVIPGDGVAKMRQMHADLVRPPGVQVGLEQRRTINALPGPEHSQSVHPAGMDAHPSLPFGGHIFVQREVHSAFPESPIASHENEVLLGRATFPQGRVQRAQQSKLTREPDYATLMPAIVPDEPMVTTWVALDQVEDSFEAAPRFDFVQILSAKTDAARPVLIAAQKQPKAAAASSARAPMVAPAPK